MRKYLFVIAIFILPFSNCQAQEVNSKDLKFYEDSLTSLGKKFINSPEEIDRINTNMLFIKTLVSALKLPNSFHYPFDSLKSITIINSPDNHFRILSWHIIFDDGSYRFYGAVQINTNGNLQLYPLLDYSPELKNAEDSVTDARKWYGAQYYKIIPVNAPKPYYVLLGWKGNTERTTKKVIDVISFNNNKPEFGLGVFDGNGKNRKRVIFEYTRQASMLLRYVPEQTLIVFDHLSPADPKSKNRPETYGPDLSYDGYKLKNGRWVYLSNLDMRNVPDAHDAEYNDPKKQASLDRTGGNN